MNFRSLSFSFGVAAAIALPAGANAASINIGDFTSAQVVDTFSSASPFGSSVTRGAVTYTDLNGPGLDTDTDWSGYFSSFPGASKGTALNDVIGQTSLRISFAEPVLRAGFLFSTTPITTLSITAYGASDNALETISATMPGEGSAAFAGIERSEGIAYLVVSEPSDNGNITLFDDVRYETNAVPEPASMAALGFGALALIRRRRKD